MTSAKATEFLIKQLKIEKEIVTFRWLSRVLAVHVNVAKNELASFYVSSQATDEPVHATYLLTGEVSPVNAAGTYRDDDQDDMEVDDINTAPVATSKIVLVGEDDLETAKAQFMGPPSVHVYSLSPSVLRDPALLALMADRVRPDDVSKGLAYNQTIGIVVGPDVKVDQMNRSAAAEVTKARTSASSLILDSRAAEKVTDTPKSSDKGKAPDQPRRDEKKKGTLDWSKAKTKDDKDTEAVNAKRTKEQSKQESKVRSKEKDGNSSTGGKKEREEGKTKVKKEPEVSKTNSKMDISLDRTKQGTKRRSGVMCLSDSDDNPSPKTKRRFSTSPLSSRPASRANGIQVKKGVLLSEEEEDENSKTEKHPLGRKKGKARFMASDNDDDEEGDPSLKTMMDLDDSEVTHHNQASAAAEKVSDDVDAEMLSDSEPIPSRPSHKKKPKKKIPVGKNGLPKKRVVKSKKSKNAKGYTITEDYSSYESVSESEHIPTPSDTKKRLKTGRKKVKKYEVAVLISESDQTTSKPRTNLKAGVDASENAKGEITTHEGKPETTQPGSGSAGGINSANDVKTSNGGKNNLMNYFGKK